MNNRQRKRAYQKEHGYNLDEADRIQKMICDNVGYTEQRLREWEHERMDYTYAGFLKSIKQRSKNQSCWWRRCK